MPEMNLVVKLFASLLLVFGSACAATATPILVLAESNRLLRFETTAPQFVQSETTVTGLQSGERLLAIDFRPSNGQLYGVTNASRLYVINIVTGVATQVGSSSLNPVLSYTQDVAFDFDPVRDQIRIVTDNRQNLRVNPDSAAVVSVDSPVAFDSGDPNASRAPAVSAAAYSNNVAGASSTTLYAVSMGFAQNTTVPTLLVTQGNATGSISPDTGKLFTIGAMGFLFIEPTGLDIGADGVAYALLNGTDTRNELYRVDLATGALSRIAIIGGGSDQMRDLAVVPANSSPPAGTFQFDTASYNVAENATSIVVTVTRTGDISGSASVEFVSMDGTTASQRSDYIIASGRLDFSAGQTTKTFRILIVDDVYVEPIESFSVILFNATAGFLPADPNLASISILDDDTSPPTTNPIDDAQFFVRQQYFDFLNRLPDAGGLAYWTGQITSCGANTICINRRRTAVSAAFFFSPEFQDTGYFAYRTYVVALSREPFYAEFTRARSRLVAGPNLDANRTAFIADFVLTPEFGAQHPDTDTPERYVDDLNSRAGLPLTQSERDALVAGLRNGTETRATVLRTIVDNPIVKQRFFNRAFVLIQYYGYLRRNPDPGGFVFWLDILDRTNNFTSMVCAFSTSPEYQQRFSPILNHGNQECGQ